ncbi:MAG: HAMP domain-containing protein, partial [Rhizobiales bacterium]|nr:HAMP domain-containing protein [Hyphomicrobiales bacterium]
MPSTLPGLSVRARIAALALIPVVGFGAYAVTYVSSERDGSVAFETVRVSAHLTETSLAFKNAVGAMRNVALAFAARPRQSLSAEFFANNRQAIENLIAIESMLGTGTDEVASARQELAALSERFAAIDLAQSQLGFSAHEGVRLALSNAAGRLDQAIEKDLAGSPAADRDALKVPLLGMRRSEAEYRLDGHDDLHGLFAKDQQAFVTRLAALDIPEARKAELKRQLDAYRQSFDAWAAGVGHMLPTIAEVATETEELLPLADRLVRRATERTGAARVALETAQARTRHIIVAVGFAIVALGLLLSWWIGRGITRPLLGLGRAMEQLAEGDTSVTVPAVGEGDEIGRMARTVLVFRDNALERERLSAMQRESSRTRERRVETIAVTIAGFERSVALALANLRTASQRLETSATGLTGAADAMSTETRSAEDRTVAASENVASAAGSAEELAGSISEIAHQADRSRMVATQAV